MTTSFTHRLRIYVEDTDYGGIVHHARYLVYMERARTEWLAAIGIDYHSLVERQLHVVVRAIEVDYLKPAKLGELIEVVVSVNYVGRTSLHFHNIVRNQKNPDTIYCQGLVKTVCINNQMKPCSVPTDIMEKLT